MAKTFQNVFAHPSNGSKRWFTLSSAVVKWVQINVRVKQNAYLTEKNQETVKFSPLTLSFYVYIAALYQKEV